MNLNGESTDKLDKFRQTVEKEPDKIGPLIQLGIQLAKEGQNKEAKEVFEKALLLDPENKYVKVRLNLLDQTPEQLEKVKTDYVFTPKKRVDRINFSIRIAFLSIIAIILLFVLKFIFFPSTCKLLVDGNHNSFPRWSPDGKYFGYYFIRGTDMQFRSLLGGDFYIADADGENGKPFEIEDPDKCWMKDRDYQWSFNSEYLSLQRDYNHRYYVSVVNLKSSEINKIEPGGCIAWSPVENKMAYLSGSYVRSFQYGDGEIKIYDAVTKESKSLTNGRVKQISWSGDGRWIAFVRSASRREQPEKQLDLSINPLPKYGDNHDEEEQKTHRWWSCFSSATDIWKVNINSGELVQLTKGGESCRPIWLPKDKGIIFSKPIDNCLAEMWNMDSDGKNKRKLYDKSYGFNAYSSFLVSPDGKWLAYTQSVSISDLLDEETELLDEMSFKSVSDIFLMKTDGTDVHRLKNTHDSKYSPSFSKNGRWIAYHIRPLGTKTQIWKTKVK